MKTDVNRNSVSSDSSATWEQRWEAMDPIDQRELWDRVAVTPFKAALRPWWQKLAVSPVAWWKHYRLSRKYMGRFRSVRWACVWTGVFLFPTWFKSK